MPETSFLCCWELTKAHLHIPYLKKAGEKNVHKDWERQQKSSITLSFGLLKNEQSIHFLLLSFSHPPAQNLSPESP